MTVDFGLEIVDRALALVGQSPIQENLHFRRQEIASIYALQKVGAAPLWFDCGTDLSVGLGPFGELYEVAAQQSIVEAASWNVRRILLSRIHIRFSRGRRKAVVEMVQGKDEIWLSSSYVTLGFKGYSYDGPLTFQPAF